MVTPGNPGLPVPTPGPGQALVRIEARGVRHTDIHAAYDDWPVKPALPLTPRPRGHRGQYARIASGIVAVVDIEPTNLELAVGLGADYAVNAAADDSVAAIKARGAPTSPSRSPPRSRSARPSRARAAVADWYASACPPTAR